jgi:hypothetical protein
MGEGASQLLIPVPQAVAAPPDVITELQVPGGVTVPLTPSTASGTPRIRRNQARIDFQAQQGTTVTVRRIHVALPVFLQEQSLEEPPEVTNEEIKLYKTEAEAKEAAEGKEGTGSSSKEIQPISATTRFEERHTIFEPTFLGGKFAKFVERLAIARSVLPIDVTVKLAIIGPEGEMWSEGYTVPVRYMGLGAAGAGAIGTGTIDAYSDLVNGIELNTEKQYGLLMSVFVPTTKTTDLQLGVEMSNNAAVLGKGGVTLFYDIATGAPGK